MKIKICPKCQQENSDTARTCVSCKADLRTVRPKDAGFVRKMKEEEKSDLKQYKECPECRHKNPANSNKCANCGESLVGELVKTDAAPEVEHTEAKKPAEKPASGATAVNRDVLDQIWLVTTDNIFKYQIPDGETILGRQNVGAEYFSVKDFVGRTQARITRMGEMVMIEDLNSTNGTYVNGERLEAGVPKRITTSDTIGLGGNHVSQTRAAFFKIVQ